MQFISLMPYRLMSANDIDAATGGIVCPTPTYVKALIIDRFLYPITSCFMDSDFTTL